MSNISLSAGINVTLPSVEETLVYYLGEKRKDTGSVVVLTLIYVCIFISGTVGNMSTCVVIARNPYMHTVTNYYLFSLAISDLLILLSGELSTLYDVVNFPIVSFTFRRCLLLYTYKSPIVYTKRETY
jgi:hypothetical protein